MPRRSAYAGDAGIFGGDGYPLIPMQQETLTFLARFSTAPSAAFKNALNLAIYRWKRDSVYSLILDLWLFCADTQADALRNLISATRDATIAGAPTFTANKGFGPCSTSNYVSMPFSTAVNTTSFFPFFGGQVDSSANAANIAMGSAIDRCGAVRTHPTSDVAMGWSMAGNNAPVFANGASEPGLCAGLLTYNLTAAGKTVAQSSAAYSGVTTNPITSDTAFMKRVTTYGWLNSTATDAQVRKFLRGLQGLLDDLGALD